MSIRLEVVLAFCAVASLAPLHAAAQKGGMDHGSMEQPGMMAQQAGAMSEGEIRKVDKDAGKLTIKHGPIANLDMPAMTMVFRVKDAAWLERVKPGDKVKFSADKIGGAYTVTAIEKQP